MEVLQWVQLSLLASMRLAVGLTMTPLFSAFGVPVLARLVLTLVFAGLAAAVAPHQVVSLSVAGMLSASVVEIGVGLLFALGIHTAFASFDIAGKLLDTQMGLALGAVLDPVSRSHAAVLARGWNLFAILMFFLSDVHHVLLAAFFQTFEVIPIGSTLSIEGWLPAAFGAGAMFSLGLMMAAPVAVALLLADVVIAVVSRSMPQMNILVVSIPVKVLLGLSVLSAAVPWMMPVVRKALLLPMTLIDKVQ